MICTFFGHRDAPFSIMSDLRNAILDAIMLGATTFYVENNGNLSISEAKNRFLATRGCVYY